MALNYPIIQINNNTFNNIVLVSASPANDQILQLNNMTFLPNEGYEVSANTIGSGTINPGASDPILNGQELLLGDVSNNPPEFIFAVVISKGSILCQPVSGQFSLAGQFNSTTNSYILTVGLS